MATKIANICGLAEGELKCHRCAICDGYGCPGMLPGLGGVFEGKNSIKAVKDICNKNNINSDIVDFVYEVIIEKISPIKAFNKLWEKIE